MTPMATKPDLRRRRPLDVIEILRWADTYKVTTGCWPTKDSGGVVGTVGESWLGIDSSLRNGMRGLPGGSSLARLLEERRGVRNRKALPKLSDEQILAWADAHHARTGKWPNINSGPVVAAPGERPDLIDNALRAGQRGLPTSGRTPWAASTSTVKTLLLDRDYPKLGAQDSVLIAQLMSILRGRPCPSLPRLQSDPRRPPPRPLSEHLLREDST